MPLHLTASEFADLKAGTPSKKAHKFGAVPVVVDGVRHDSTKESRRWAELCMMQRAGLISKLARQVVYELAPSVKFTGSPRAKPALRMVVDFQYVENGVLVAEDTKGGGTKGTETQVFRIKRHLLLHVHGIQLKIT